MTPYYFDIETASHPDASRWIEPFVPDVEPNRSIKDEAKQAAWMADKLAAQRAEYDKKYSKLALDPWVGRIVALTTAGEMGPAWPTLIHNEHEERDAIAGFYFNLVSDPDLTPIGWNSRAFDHRFINVRARLLGLKVPEFLDHLRYNKRLIDLYEVATDGENAGHYPAEKMMGRGMVSVASRFGIDLPEDDIKGADIALAVAEGRWDDIARHNVLDVLRTRELAKRLGV